MSYRKGYECIFGQCAYPLSAPPQEFRIPTLHGGITSPNDLTTAMIARVHHLSTLLDFTPYSLVCFFYPSPLTLPDIIRWQYAYARLEFLQGSQKQTICLTFLSFIFPLARLGRFGSLLGPSQSWEDMISRPFLI